MRAQDEIRLRHMLEAARETVSFSRGRADLGRDRQLLVSPVKDIEICRPRRNRRRFKLPLRPWNPKSD